MFRFIHTADLHLDSPLQGLSMRDETATSDLLGASRKAFDNLIRLAIDEAVDFVVIAGDVYDRDWKGYETGIFFRKGMVRLQDADIPVFLIAGNHDAASVITRKLSLPGNVHSFSSRKAETVEPEALPVAIHGMSFPNRAVEENLVPGYPSPVPGKFNLGILHTSLAGREGHDTYAPCSVNDLVAKGYDYWALGHIHQPEVVQEDPWIVYAGNLQGRHTRECGARGCRIVTVDDNREVTACDWHALDVARWAQADINVGGLESFDEVLHAVRSAMGKCVEEAEDRLLALRVILTGSTSLHGMLCSHPDRLEAEVQSMADEFGEGVVWLEKMKLATKPLVSLAELAERDELTKVVVKVAQEQTSSGALPPEVGEMLETLPGELKQALTERWRGPERSSLVDDACAIILERLMEKGGEA
jgi:DNA repair protein SbcD/Mre11